MNLVDAYVLALLAIADIAFLAYLRSRRSKAMRDERMMRCLELAIRRASKRRVGHLPAMPGTPDGHSLA